VRERRNGLWESDSTFCQRSFGEVGVIQCSDAGGSSTRVLRTQLGLWVRVSVQADPHWCFHRLRDGVNSRLKTIDPFPQIPERFAL